MATTVTRKGQVTVPKRIRNALGINPGTQVAFEVNKDGEVVLRKAGRTHRKFKRDRFEAARGRADVKYRTDDLMALLRGE
jgi:AbrB family looped-hinge helix DNA binding protein